MDLTPSALAQWVKQARADRTKGKAGLTTEERAELARLRKDDRERRMERDVLKKSRGLLREGPPVTFAWIQTEKATYPLAKLCQWLDVTRSDFYAWRGRPESTHTRDERRLKVLVRASCEASKPRDGSPRVHEDLLEQDEYVSRKRVVRLMQEDGLKARRRTRYKLTTMSDHDQPVAANLLDRQCEADAPNQRWVGDTTEFVIGGRGKLDFAAILDLFSRFLVGWAVSAVNDHHLTIKALQMALQRRYPDAGRLHHSDQGCTYASEDYQDVLDTHGMTCRMSRRGNCYDCDEKLLLDGQERTLRALRQQRRGHDGVVRLHRRVL